MEYEPTARLQYEGGEFDATPNNSHLYTFMGNLALYNHTFHFHTEGEERANFYIFESVDPEGYKPLAEFMLQQGFPAHLNMREIHNTDIEAHERATFRRLEQEWGSDVDEEVEE